MRQLLRLQRLIAVAGFAAAFAQNLPAQEELPPEFLRAHALVVRFLASSFDSRGPEAGPGTAQSQSPGPVQSQSPGPVQSQSPGPVQGSPQSVPGKPVASRSPSSPELTVPQWTTVARRYTVTGAPVAIRLSGANIVIVVQVTPYDRGKLGLQIVAQGQVWSRGPDGAIAYHSAFESLDVGFGEPVYFFPLGINADGTTALKVEIAVDHFGDTPSIPDPPAQKQSVPGTPVR
ncbi:MAG TPA: hypothetical protein VMV83_12265 [Rectinemataceae bacterium]|nr:hypothetical protein [Rectinemataceae bacterium]